MSEKDSGINFTIGLLFGAVVGVAIGFLYAPKPGKETRELLKEKAEAAKEKAAEVTQKAKEAATEAKKKVEEKLVHHKETEA